jgi:hypothetical protein
MIEASNGSSDTGPAMYFVVTIKPASVPPPPPGDRFQECCYFLINNGTLQPPPSGQLSTTSGSVCVTHITSSTCAPFQMPALPSGMVEDTSATLVAVAASKELGIDGSRAQAATWTQNNVPPTGPCVTVHVTPRPTEPGYVGATLIFQVLDPVESCYRLRVSRDPEIKGSVGGPRPT